LKGAHAFIECIGGLALAFVSTTSIVGWVNRLTQRLAAGLFEGDPLERRVSQGCRPLALYTAAALGSARKSISAFAAIGCVPTGGRRAGAN
jgi:hypothetical protein